jgi:hypothetical protein
MCCGTSFLEGDLMLPVKVALIPQRDSLLGKPEFMDPFKVPSLDKVRFKYRAVGRGRPGQQIMHCLAHGNGEGVSRLARVELKVLTGHSRVVHGPTHPSDGELGGVERGAALNTGDPQEQEAFLVR